MGKENKITWKNLVARFKAPTPQFWKAMRLKMLALAVALGALGTGLQDIEGLGVDIYTFAKYIVRIGALIPLAIAFLSSFAIQKDNTESISKPPNDTPIV